MKILIGLVAISAISLTGCDDLTKPDESFAILKRDGCQDISINGYAWRGCSEDDTFRTAFTATKNGQFVEGVVCSGYLNKFSLHSPILA